MRERKLCRGPAHPQPTWLPLADFGFNGPYLQGQCKLCRGWLRLQTKEGPHGLVPAASLAKLALELTNRCGSLDKAADRSGVNRQTLLRLIHRKQPQVRRQTAQQLLIGLAEQRKVDRRNGASPRFLAARKAQAQIEERVARDGCG
jgi:hypothetical protein